MTESIPAFPVPNDANVNGQPGMDLRDWFAGQCLSAAMASASGLGDATPEERAEAFAVVAGLLYEVADAMMAERAKASA